MVFVVVRFKSLLFYITLHCSVCIRSLEIVMQIFTMAFVENFGNFKFTCFVVLVERIHILKYSTSSIDD